MALSLTRRRHPQFRPAAAGSAGAFLIAMLSIPALVMLACWLAGIWPQFRYCVFQHNLPVARGDYAWWRPLIFALSLPLLCWGAVRLPRADTAKVDFLRRIFFLLLTGISFAVFWGFWPIVSRQDYLPLYPLAAVCVSALILHLSECFRRPAAFARMAVEIHSRPGLVCAGPGRAVARAAFFLDKWCRSRDTASARCAGLDPTRGQRARHER